MPRHRAAEEEDQMPQTGYRPEDKQKGAQVNRHPQSFQKRERSWDIAISQAVYRISLDKMNARALSLLLYAPQDLVHGQQV